MTEGSSQRQHNQFVKDVHEPFILEPEKWDGILPCIQHTQSTKVEATGDNARSPSWNYGPIKIEVLLDLRPLHPLSILFILEYLMNTGSQSNSQEPQAWNWDLTQVDTGEGRANRTTEQQSNVPADFCSQMPTLSGCIGE